MARKNQTARPDQATHEALASVEHAVDQDNFDQLLSEALDTFGEDIIGEW